MLRDNLVRILVSAALLAFCAAPNAATRKSRTTAATKTMAAPKFDNDVTWALILPEDDVVEFHGAVNFDRAGGKGGGMMYPAPNAAGLVAGIITQGLLNEGMKKREKTKLQQEADKVLVPYADILKDLSNKELASQALQKLQLQEVEIADEKAKIKTAWRVAVQPAFTLSEDGSVIWLVNTFTVSAAEKPKSAYSLTTKVFSETAPDAEREAFWSGGNGVRLRDTSVDLFAESIELMLQELTDGPRGVDSAHQTVRYREGSVEKMERVQIGYNDCERVVLRTLRGWPMSLPLGALAESHHSLLPHQGCRALEGAASIEDATADSGDIETTAATPNATDVVFVASPEASP